MPEERDWGFDPEFSFQAQEDDRQIHALRDVLGLDDWSDDARDDHPIRASGRLASAGSRHLHSPSKEGCHFGPAFFGEPAWEMLLVLYVSQRTHRSTTTQIARLSQAPMTTALRWMEALEREDLVERQRHPTDGRMTFIRLTAKGHSAVELYLSETMPEGD